MIWTREHIYNMRNNKMVSRNRVTPAILQRLNDSIPAELKTPDGQTEALAMATGVLRVFLGSEWVEKHVISDNAKKGFFSVKEQDIVQREISFFRLMDLAEILLIFSTCQALMNASTG